MDDELRQNVAGNSNDVKTMLNGNSFQTRKLYKCSPVVIGTAVAAVQHQKFELL